MPKQVYKIKFTKDGYGEDKDYITYIEANSPEEAAKLAPGETKRDCYKGQKTEIISIENTGQYRVEDIIRPFPFSTYSIDLPMDYLESSLKRYTEHYNLDMNPDFQRGHVWTEEQQIAFVEYALRGGVSGKDIYFNAANWQGNGDVGDMVIVDGKQRLEAIRKFLRGELVVFGKYRHDDFFRPQIGLKFHINNLKTRKEVLQWYCDFNAGGVVHSKEEIARVKKLIEKE